MLDFALPGLFLELHIPLSEILALPLLVVGLVYFPNHILGLADEPTCSSMHIHLSSFFSQIVKKGRIVDVESISNS
jgi:hypothetical protein